MATDNKRQSCYHYQILLKICELQSLLKIDMYQGEDFIYFLKNSLNVSNWHPHFSL